jgi:hypothetical protein
MLPWRTTAGGEQAVVINLLSAKSLTGIWLIRTNFSQVIIQGNSVDNWVAPPFGQSFTVARNPWNFRYQLAVPLTRSEVGVFGAFNYQYLCIRIPPQTPVDGTSAYLLGGVYAGVLETFPRDVRYEVEFTTVHPRQDVVQQYSAWRQRLVMGEPLVQLSMVRSARTTKLAPGYADDLKSWLSIERRIRDNDFFALMFGASDTSQGFVMRPINQGHGKWTRINQLRSNSTIELEEVVGP